MLQQKWLNDDTDDQFEEVDLCSSSQDGNKQEIPDPKTLHSQAISVFNTYIKYKDEQEVPAGDILKLVNLRDVAFKIFLKFN